MNILNDEYLSTLSGGGKTFYNSSAFKQGNSYGVYWNGVVRGAATTVGEVAGAVYTVLKLCKYVPE